MPAGWMLPEPWSMLLTSGEAARRPFEADDEAEVAGSRSASVALPAACTAVTMGPRREPLPHLGAPFDLGGGPLRSFALPFSSHNDDGSGLPADSFEELRFQVDHRPFTIGLRQTGCAGRPTPSTPKLATGQVLQDFIDWQVGCYQELLDLDFASSMLDGEAFGVVRRDNAAVRAAWLRLGIEESDPARMALIVRLARDKDLARVLEALCRSPRRILERYRDKERLGRVQQLDAACLRWYARQPGRTAPEKAGPRQELLAVRRREAFDTLENRVLKWVVEECIALATRYLAENHRNRTGSARCRDVSGFRRLLQGLLRAGPLSSVTSRLPHPVQPNYQLQQSQTYRLVWSTYVLLMAERRVQDDAWRWQRVLWKESCQQIFSACLTAPDAPVKQVWPASAAYMRSESEVGRWTEPPSAPGPFALANGRTLHLVDPRDGAPPAGWCPWLGSLGGDMALVSTSRAGAVEQGCVVWFVQDWAPETKLTTMLGRCAMALSRAHQQAELAGLSSVPLDGMLMLNGRAGGRKVEVDQEDVAGTARQVVAMRLPPDLHEHTEDVRVGVGLLLEQLTRAPRG